MQPNPDAISFFSDDFQSHMVTFLSYLTFWQDVLEHCRSTDVRHTLIDHFQVLFLQQLLYVLFDNQPTQGISIRGLLFAKLTQPLTHVQIPLHCPIVRRGWRLVGCRAYIFATHPRCVRSSRTCAYDSTLSARTTRLFSFLAQGLTVPSGIEEATFVDASWFTEEGRRYHEPLRVQSGRSCTTEHRIMKPPDRYCFAKADNCSAWKEPRVCSWVLGQDHQSPSQRSSSNSGRTEH